jgi:hypothetical protein
LFSSKFWQISNLFKFRFFFSNFEFYSYSEFVQIQFLFNFPNVVQISEF